MEDKKSAPQEALSMLRNALSTTGRERVRSRFGTSPTAAEVHKEILGTTAYVRDERLRELLKQRLEGENISDFSSAIID